jgi:hypothetical protein
LTTTFAAMLKTVARILVLIAGTCISVAGAQADGQGSYVPCDNGLRCVMAPCPSASALDLTTGKVVKGVWVDTDGLPQVVTGTIQNRPHSFNGKQYSLPTLVATGIESSAKDSEREHCSSH